MNIDDLFDDIDAVVVDWDGTVVDSSLANYAALNHALRQYGVKLDRRWYREHAGLSIVDLLNEVTAIHGGLPITDIIGASRQRLVADLHRLRPVPATIELLDRAHDRGLPSAVASGTVGHLVTGGIRVLHLAHLFAVVVTREHVRNGKPAPDLYLQAATMLGVAPQRCLAVDDAADGIAAAHEAGMRVLTIRDHALSWAAPSHTIQVDAEYKATP